MSGVWVLAQTNGIQICDGHGNTECLLDVCG